MRRWCVDAERPEPRAVAEAAALLAGGGVIVLPTETYYGLAADLRCPPALDRVLEIKGRGAGKPLLLLVAGVGMARRLAPAAPPLLERLAGRWWPGPLTLVLPAPRELPATVVSDTGGVAVRHSSHPVVQALLERLGAPLTGTSANLAGQPPARAAGALVLGGSMPDGIVDAGPAPGGPPSTLLDIRSVPARLLRPGAVGAEALAEELPEGLV